MTEHCRVGGTTHCYRLARFRGRQAEGKSSETRSSTSSTFPDVAIAARIELYYLRFLQKSLQSAWWSAHVSYSGARPLISMVSASVRRSRLAKAADAQKWRWKYHKDSYMNVFNKPCSFYPMPTSPGGKDPKYWSFVHGLYKKKHSPVWAVAVRKRSQQ